jgi:regulator of protease activity HflC (stomatin/prohibitin superfamily)
MLAVLLAVAAIGLLACALGLRILREDERGVVFRLGRLLPVEIPEAMQRAMARQAEAERERRAKVIGAEGEYQAAEKLLAAGNIIGASPAALQLRYLQTLLEVGTDGGSTIVFPLPLDLLKPFLDGRSPQPSHEQPQWKSGS